MNTLERIRRDAEQVPSDGGYGEGGWVPNDPSWLCDQLIESRADTLHCLKIIEFQREQIDALERLLSYTTSYVHHAERCFSLECLAADVEFNESPHSDSTDCKVGPPIFNNVLLARTACNEARARVLSEVNSIDSGEK